MLVRDEMALHLRGCAACRSVRLVVDLCERGRALARALGFANSAPRPVAAFERVPETPAEPESHGQRRG